MHKKRSFSVAVIGIPDNERQIIQNIFKLSSYRTRSYALTASAMDADILIVSEGAKSTVTQTIGPQSPNQSSPPMITVAGTEPANDPYSLKRPFVATRVLSVLDQVVSKELSFAPERVISDDNSPSHKTMEVFQDRSATEPAVMQPSYLALVVDDSLAVRKLMDLELRALSIHGDFAENGVQAFELIKNNDYDIIFLDVVLPDIDGYKICKTIKKDKTKKRIPVLMLTGKSSAFDRVRGKFSGCDSYLTKPAQSDTLRKAVKQYLSIELNPKNLNPVESLPDQKELIQLAELT
jgi:twitching motility two-component system response regulator PilG